MCLQSVPVAIRTGVSACLTASGLHFVPVAGNGRDDPSLFRWATAAEQLVGDDGDASGERLVLTVPGDTECLITVNKWNATAQVSVSCQKLQRW